MKLRVYSTSRSFQSHMNSVIEIPFDYQSNLGDSGSILANISLLHISSPEVASLDWIAKWFKDTNRIVGVCSDQPNVVEMLECVEAGARAYCNSYMQPSNYQQLLRMLTNGQSWFPPAMLAQTFELAQQSIKGKDIDTLLQSLTGREKEISIAVSKGFSNRQIAEQFEISERTVKTHLTNIFLKLELKDRVALVIYLR